MPRGGPQPGSGRPKGVPNKQSRENRILIEKTLGASPLEKMARLAKELLEGKKHRLMRPIVVDKEIRLVYDRGFELKLAADLLKDVATYHSAKRKAIEITDGEGNSIPMPLVYLPDNGRGPKAVTNGRRRTK